MPNPDDYKTDSAPEVTAGIQRADRMGAFLVALPKWTAIAVIAWQIRLSIEALAGKYAFPSLLTRFWRQASAWEVVCWVAGISGLLFGLYTRHLLNRQAARDLSRLDSMEQLIENMSASNTGATRRGSGS